MELPCVDRWYVWIVTLGNRMRFDNPQCAVAEGGVVPSLDSGVLTKKETDLVFGRLHGCVGVHVRVFWRK